jgi:hypothetical protein
MTGETDHNPPPDASLPPVSRAAESFADQSNLHETVHEPVHEPVHGPRIWPRVVGVLILLLGAGGAWVWQNPGILGSTFGSMFSTSSNQEAEAAEIEALDGRVTHLEQRQPADLTSLSQRLDALESRAGTAPPGADFHSLEVRLDALEARVPAGGQSAPPTAATDLRPLIARIETLEKSAARQATEPAKVEAMESKVEALSTHDPAAELRGRLDDLTRQLNDLTASTTKQTLASNSAERIAGLSVALALGRPLGPIPDAPPALARFATVAPPAEAALRLSFPAAAQAALKVSRPDTGGKPFLDSVIARLQDFKLITVREGDHVLIGNADAATLARAQVLLDAGDLAGAARTVAALTGPPAEKMASWLADANALVAAREALATLAGNG